jgi:hypothetical protein
VVAETVNASGKRSIHKQPGSDRRVDAASASKLRAPAFPSEACLCSRLSKLLGRSSDLQATYLLQLPSPRLTSV